MAAKSSGHGISDTLRPQYYRMAESNAPVALYTATYDGLGNRLTVRELDGDQSQYTYDGVSYRMSMDDGGASYTYADDLANAQVVRTWAF